MLTVALSVTPSDMVGKQEKNLTIENTVIRPFYRDVQIIQENSLLPTYDQVARTLPEPSPEPPRLVKAVLYEEENITEVKAYIRENYPEIYNVIQCESGWDNSKRGLAGEIGICQYMPGTFAYFSKLSGLAGNIYSAQDQINLTVWAFNNNFKNDWSCWNNRY